MSTRIQLPARQVPERGMRVLVDTADLSLALFNVEGQFYAIDDSCPHQGASLCGGKLAGKVIQCCAHGLRFDLATGYLLNSTLFKLANYPIEVEGDQVFIVIAPEESAP